MTTSTNHELESWRPVVGYEGLYEVSDRGSVRSLGRVDRLGRQWKPRPMSGSRDGEGYVVHSLTPAPVAGTSQVTQRIRAHVLVLEAFVGPRPAGMEVCHANDIPTDNRLANLRWDLPAANCADRLRNRTRLTARRPPRNERLRGHCARGHKLTEPNLTNALAGGRRRCLACRRGHNAVRDAAKQGRLLDLDTECHRHHALIMAAA